MIERRVRSVLFICGWVLAACGAATTDRDGMGSETDWLSACREDADCERGSCLCGVCTVSCDDVDACDDIAQAGCLQAAELAGCEAPPPSDRGICSTEAALDEVERHIDPTGELDLEDDLELPAGVGGESMVFDNLRQSGVDKVDLLFMIDNSLSMGDKQELLAQALPDLVRRLVDPVCVSQADERDLQDSGPDGCAPGYAREFGPIDDIHIGVITSSLGGFGSDLDCTNAEEGETDNGHLLGSLERVRTVLPTTPTFLGWCRPGSDSAENGHCAVTPETSDGDAAGFSAVFADQVREAREQGCGWEASLEAWYHFLVDPYPWTSVVRQNCPFGGDVNQLCIGPATDPSTGLRYVDDTILQQREAFLRADSLLTIVMLTDENDCSFKASGQSWRLSQTYRRDTNTGMQVASRAYKGSAACQDDPNSECCVSCGEGVPEGCPTTMNEVGETVNAGCEQDFYKSADDLATEGSSEVTDDAVNLRCFDQKRRFGVDYLYPVERYSNALKLGTICPFADTLDPEATNSDGSPVCADEYLVQNPLFTDLGYEARRAADPDAESVIPRTGDLVFLAGIVGVPWQDLAVDPAADSLVYRSNHPADAPNVVDWVQLLGDATPGAAYDLRNAPPSDPLMWEQIEPRNGTNPAINGGEWNILLKDDLQYACTFPLAQPQVCPGIDELDPSQTAACDCTYYGGEEYGNPLCDGLTQHSAKAYPSIRPLQVLRDFGQNSIVASICPKNTTDESRADYGYRPAVAAIVDGLGESLLDRCLGRELALDEDGARTSCRIFEATSNGDECDPDEARSDASSAAVEQARRYLEQTFICADAEDCARFTVCEIQQLEPGTEDHDNCLTAANPTGDGFCYVDPEQGLGDESQVVYCPATARRKIRFAGNAAPKKGTFTFLSCPAD